MKTRNWGLGILALGAIAAVTAGTIAPHGDVVPGPKGSGAGFARVAPAASPKPGIVDEVLNLIQEPKAVFNARTNAGNACMAARGFPQFPQSGQGDLPNDMRFGLYNFAPLSLEKARESAYLSVTNIETGGYLVGDTVAEGMQNAYWGIDKASGKVVDPAGGCRGAGIIAAYGSLDAESTTRNAFTIVGPAVQSAREDQAFQTALGDWAGCMRDAGYPTLKAPNPAPGVWKQTIPPVNLISDGPETRKLAVADVTCREKTRLIQRLDEVLARYLTTAVEQHASELAKVKTIREQAAARAASLSK